MANSILISNSIVIRYAVGNVIMSLMGPKADQLMKTLDYMMVES